MARCLNPLSHTGTQDRLYEKILGQVAGSLILTSLYPKTVIKITCQVMSQDGSILSSAINAMILALLDSGIPMKATCCAASCMISKNGDLILDPTALELEVQYADFVKFKSNKTLPRTLYHLIHSPLTRSMILAQ